jgi:uncharacterized membrane protein
MIMGEEAISRNVTLPAAPSAAPAAAPAPGPADPAASSAPSKGPAPGPGAAGAAQTAGATPAPMPLPTATPTASSGTGRKVQGQPLPDASINPIAHYYRAEVHRSIAWRHRMDATTNWAILSATALISVAYSHRDMPHVLIPMGGVIVLLLLCIEARRYRFYDVWRSRARLLEAHMIVPFLLPEHTLLQGNWRETLAEDLLMPAYKMSYWRAAGSRLRRNYIWIFLILLGAWILRVFLYDGPIENARQFYDALGVGPIPPWLVLGFTGVFYVALAIWMYLAGTGDDPDVLVYKRIRNRGMTPWPI